MRIGIDLGGTKIEGVALGTEGQELARRRVPTPRTYEGSLEAIRGLVVWLEDSAGGRGSVGVFGPFERLSWALASYRKITRLTTWPSVAISWAPRCYDVDLRWTCCVPET